MGKINDQFIKLTEFLKKYYGDNMTFKNYAVRGIKDRLKKKGSDLKFYRKINAPSPEASKKIENESLRDRYIRLTTMLDSLYRRKKVLDTKDFLSKYYKDYNEMAAAATYVIGSFVLAFIFANIKNIVDLGWVVEAVAAFFGVALLIICMISGVIYKKLSTGEIPWWAQLVGITQMPQYDNKETGVKDFKKALEDTVCESRALVESYGAGEDAVSLDEFLAKCNSDSDFYLNMAEELSPLLAYINSEIAVILKEYPFMEKLDPEILEYMIPHLEYSRSQTPETIFRNAFNAAIEERSMIRRMKYEKMVAEYNAAMQRQRERHESRMQCNGCVHASHCRKYGQGSGCGGYHPKRR